VDSDPHLLPRIDGVTLSVRYNGMGTDALAGALGDDA